MARRKLAGLRCILTGASSGIGRELARQLTAAAVHVVATARRQQRLEELAAELAGADGKLLTVPGDITEPGLREQLIATAQEQLGGLDLVINNAGVGALGPFSDADEARLRQVMEVNFFAPVELLRVALPLLREGNQPMIVNIGSVLGHRSVPRKSEYCASKFALHGFSDSLRAELAKQGIVLLHLCPSTTSSEFFDNLVEKKGKLPKWSKGGMSPEAVAKVTLKAIRRGNHEVVLTLGGKFLVTLDRCWPWLADKLTAKFG